MQHPSQYADPKARDAAELTAQKVGAIAVLEELHIVVRAAGVLTHPGRSLLRLRSQRPKNAPSFALRFSGHSLAVISSWEARDCNSGH